MSHASLDFGKLCRDYYIHSPLFLHNINNLILHQNDQVSSSWLQFAYSVFCFLMIFSFTGKHETKQTPDYMMCKICLHQFLNNKLDHVLCFLNIMFYSTDHKKIVTPKIFCQQDHLKPTKANKSSKTTKLKQIVIVF